MLQEDLKRALKLANEMEKSGGLLLMPFFDYLVKKGYPFKAQHIQIGTLPVDFVAVYDPLTEEALEEAVETEVYGVPTRVFTAEHLLAIALQTGRPQDLAKADKLYRETDLDEQHLEDIVRRHKLSRKWHEFKKRYLSAGD